MTDVNNPNAADPSAADSSAAEGDDVASAYTADVDVPPEVPSLPDAPTTPAAPTTPTPGVPPVEPGDPNPPLPDPGPRDGTHTHDGITPDQPDVGDAFAEGFEHPEQH